MTEEALASIDVLDVFGWPLHGGNVTALCQWHITAELARRAGGDPLHLATRTRDRSGLLLVDNGPRSRAIPPSEGCYEVAVPLVIPSHAGRFSVEVDAVVEHKFWLSWLGTAPTILEIERFSDGGLVVAPHHGGTPATIRAVPSTHDQRFQIPHPRYGVDDTDRCIEIPWVISRYAGERRVLDVGYAFAEPRYTAALAALNVPLLVGLDMARSNQPGMRRVVGDVRLPPFRTRVFDLIVAISVIEHIGRDNERYIESVRDRRQGDGDFRAMHSLARLLAPGGRLLLTVPFGAAEDHGWFVQYDAKRLALLVRASGLTVAEAEYYAYSGSWHGPYPPESLRTCQYRIDKGASSAMACLTLSAPI